MSLKNAQLDWPTCEVEDCQGRQVAARGRCLAHTSKYQRKAIFARLAAGAPIEVTTGVQFTEELLADLLAALPRNDHGKPRLHEADFRLAVLPALNLDRTTLVAARFDGASFQGNAAFDKARFEGDASFGGASFQGDARLDGVSFQQQIDLGAMAVAGTLVLDGIESDQPVQLEVAAWRLSCKRTRFRAGGHLRIAWAEISLEDAEIPAPLFVAMHPPAQDLIKRVGWLAETSDQADTFPAPRPSLVSVQRADVAGLVLADVDLRDCHFASAHHLDQLQFDTADAFYRAPGLLTRFGRVTSRGRHVLAEECRWRQSRPGWRDRRWRHTTSELFCSPQLEGARRPGPTELAAIYRRLRKGREDAKNEPGAAAFYYGEMEMRRHAHNTPTAERLLLGLYWLTAGYALRASRALATLAVVLAVLAVGFWQVGFGQHHPSYCRDHQDLAVPAAAGQPVGPHALQAQGDSSRLGALGTLGA
jgi:hypothetical protein